MAQESEDGQEKTEEPTEKRLRESREKGQVARSKELATAAIFGMATAVLLAFGGWLSARGGRWMREAMDFQLYREGGQIDLPARFGELLGQAFIAVSPLILACLAACFVAPALMGGFNFATKALTPDLKKIDPLKGLKRIYGRDGLVELLKSIGRVLLVAGLAGAAVIYAAPRFVGLVNQPLGEAAADGFRLVFLTMIAIAVGLFLLAAIDMPYQLWSHRQKLKMTRQEVREELKQTEGRPEVKAKIREAQQMLSQRRMMEDIPVASVVLVNPTHFAVALKYQAGTTRAPLVVAKGVDEIARVIREVADRHGVPIVSSPALARSLYRQVDIGREIPVQLYSAVAQILSYVYQLRAVRRHGGEAPELPDVQLPPGDPGLAPPEAGR